MCQNELCPLKDKCKRYLATPNEYWQSYFAPKNEPNDNCPYFIQANDREIKIFHSYMKPKVELVKGSDK